LGQKRVTQRAQKQNSYRPNENATCRAQLNGAHASAAKDADGRKSGGDGVPTKAKTHKNGSSPRRAKAKIMRRNSLRKQREALKARD
jgi:hypothetical protein